MLTNLPLCLLIISFGSLNHCWSTSEVFVCVEIVLFSSGSFNFMIFLSNLYFLIDCLFGKTPYSSDSLSTISFMCSLEIFSSSCLKSLNEKSNLWASANF